jgi:transposase
MAVATEDFTTWLAQAEIPQQRLTPQVQTVLQAVFDFRQQQGCDYYSTRLLSHFLLHCHTGLKVAQVARLLGISRPTASAQQGMSSKQVIQQAHHRLDGRPYGKLLPRFAGPIAGFLLGHPDASRADLLDFIDTTFGVTVSRIAVYKFLKKYGLDHLAQPQPPLPAAGPPPVSAPEADVAYPGHGEDQPPTGPPPPASAPASPPSPPSLSRASPLPGPSPCSPALSPVLPLPSPAHSGPVLALPAPPAEPTRQILLPSPSLVPVLAPAPPFSSDGPSMPALSC